MQETIEQLYKDSSFWPVFRHLDAERQWETNARCCYSDSKQTVTNDDLLRFINTGWVGKREELSTRDQAEFSAIFSWTQQSKSPVLRLPNVDVQYLANTYEFVSSKSMRYPRSFCSGWFWPLVLERAGDFQLRMSAQF